MIEIIEKLNIGTRGAQFFKAINQVVMQFNKNVHNLTGTTHPDTLLVGVAANEELMSKSNQYHVDVETKGELTRGYSIVDVNNRLGRAKNVRVCEEVDQSLFKEMLFDTLRKIE